MLGPTEFPDHPGKGTGAAPDLVAADPAAFALPPGASPNLGDIVVSVERAIDQAVAGRGGQTGDVRWDARDELRLLVTHGALHLCGWDHADPVEEAAMRQLERHLLDRA
jgi:probable rRNA maturation factor